MSDKNLPVGQNPVPDNGKKIHFPEGLRVLAVDDDMACLRILAAMLQKCCYKVTATTKATEALELLRKNKDNFDIVLTDVRMPDMDGFELLKIISLEMDIPVIMMSVSDDTDNVMKGVRHGARDYLVKPVRMLELKNIWQHVMRKTILDPNKSVVTEREYRESLPMKKRRGRSMEQEEETNTPSDGEEAAQKKLRFAWTQELHKKFVDAIQQLGVDKAVPRKILECMNEPELTREIIASHLQKFRNLLKKQQDSTSEERNNNTDPSRAHGSLRNTTSNVSSGNQCFPATINRTNGSGEHSCSVDGIMSLADRFSSKSETFGTSLVSQGPTILPLNQPNALLQQNLMPPQVVDPMRPAMPMTVHGHVPPHPVWVANPHPQPELNGMKYRTIHSRTKMVDDYLQISSRFSNFGAVQPGQSGFPSFGAGQPSPNTYPSFTAGQPGPSSYPSFVAPQPVPSSLPLAGCVPYSCPPGAFNLVGTPYPMIGDASTQMIPSSQPEYLVGPLQSSMPGQNEERALVASNERGGSDFRGWSTGYPFDMRGQGTDDATVNGQIPFLQLPPDNSERENNGQHNSCSSADDDLSVMVKQFGNNPAPKL